MFRRVLIFIGVVQIALGVAFIVPGAFERLLSLPTAPDWVNWMFVQTGARFLAFGYGMFLASREPERHLPWIRAMIAIQALDWIGTIAYLLTGAVTLAQVTTAAFFPLAFMAVLITRSPWGADRRDDSAVRVTG
jgi:putative Ca2+/H+ antiporter (TMEM165/GDT1 family)